MLVTRYMSWEGGVDVAAEGLIVHVARVVHTPVGSAPAGMVFRQTDPAAAPLFAGFVCPDPAVGAYFGPNIFAGTPFESAPVIEARIEVVTAGYPDAVSAKVTFAGFEIETRLTGLGDLRLIHRPAGEPMPFAQQGVEAAARAASVTINGAPVAFTLPEVGLSGGPAAVFAPNGVYAR
jgi:hypothetical protein